jgi:hypothetical protein
MGGVETKKISYLTGAEDERLQLADLLTRRRAFCGDSNDENDNKENAPRAMAFGKNQSKLYGLGEAFDELKDAEANNERFQAEIDSRELSKVVQQKGGKGWTKVEDLEHDPKKLELEAKKVKRSKLVYSGISA